jgi:hypothetical protein
VLAIRSATRRIPVLALVAAAAIGVAALGTGMGRRVPAVSTAAPAAATLPDSLGFEVEYGGIGAEGVDLIWRGVVTGPVPGRVTIWMEYAGSVGESAMPVWPVNVRLVFSADDYRSCFAAELSGSMNWRSGEMRVTGLVSDGIRLDAPLEQRVRLHRPGLSGSATLVFLPHVALGGVLPPA